MTTLESYQVVSLISCCHMGTVLSINYHTGSWYPGWQRKSPAAVALLRHTGTLAWGWRLLEEKGEPSFISHLQRTCVFKHKRPHNQDPPTLSLPFDLLLPLSYSALGIRDMLSLRARNRQGSWSQIWAVCSSAFSSVCVLLLCDWLFVCLLCSVGDRIQGLTGTPQLC